MKYAIEAAQLKLNGNTGVISMVTSAGAFGLTFIETTTPYITYIAAVIFLFIGIFTGILQGVKVWDKLFKKK